MIWLICHFSHCGCIFKNMISDTVISVIECRAVDKVLNKLQDNPNQIRIIHHGVPFGWVSSEWPDQRRTMQGIKPNPSRDKPSWLELSRSSDWPQFMAEDYTLYKVQWAINSPMKKWMYSNTAWVTVVYLYQKTPVYFCSPNWHDLLFCFSIDPRIQTPRGNTHFGYQILWQNTPARITWHQNPMALFPCVRAGTLSVYPTYSSL